MQPVVACTRVVGGHTGVIGAAVVCTPIAVITLGVGGATGRVGCIDTLTRCRVAPIDGARIVIRALGVVGAAIGRGLIETLIVRAHIHRTPIVVIALGARCATPGDDRRRAFIAATTVVGAGIAVLALAVGDATSGDRRRHTFPVRTARTRRTGIAIIAVGVCRTAARDGRKQALVVRAHVDSAAVPVIAFGTGGAAIRDGAGDTGSVVAAVLRARVPVIAHGVNETTVVIGRPHALPILAGIRRTGIAVTAGDRAATTPIDGVEHALVLGTDVCRARVEVLTLIGRRATAQHLLGGTRTLQANGNRAWIVVLAFRVGATRRRTPWQRDVSTSAFKTRIERTHITVIALAVVGTAPDDLLSFTLTSDALHHGARIPIVALLIVGTALWTASWNVGEETLVVCALIFSAHIVVVAFAVGFAATWKFEQGNTLPILTHADRAGRLVHTVLSVLTFRTASGNGEIRAGAARAQIAGALVVVVAILRALALSLFAVLAHDHVVDKHARGLILDGVRGVEEKLKPNALAHKRAHVHLHQGPRLSAISRQGVLGPNNLRIIATVHQNAHLDHVVIGHGLHVRTNHERQHGAAGLW